ncbi:MAG: hypothetical protein ABEJ43_09595 [Haloferacaceae archaeon]
MASGDEPTDGGESRTATPTDAADTPTTTALDLREADVLAVGVGGQSGGRRLSVTLRYDDEGEDEYANWWAVEALDGAEPGRREPLHARGTAPFTRSATVETGTRACVVVRGHDQSHGYGGQAALVTLDSGQVRFVRRGPDRRSFDASDCP